MSSHQQGLRTNYSSTYGMQPLLQLLGTQSFKKCWPFMLPVGNNAACVEPGKPTGCRTERDATLLPSYCVCTMVQRTSQVSDQALIYHAPCTPYICQLQHQFLPPALTLVGSSDGAFDTYSRTSNNAALHVTVLAVAHLLSKRHNAVQRLDSWTVYPHAKSMR